MDNGGAVRQYQYSNIYCDKFVKKIVLYMICFTKYNILQYILYFNTSIGKMAWAQNLSSVLRFLTTYMYTCSLKHQDICFSTFNIMYPSPYFVWVKCLSFLINLNNTAAVHFKINNIFTTNMLS